MITLLRVVARQFRAVLRRSLLALGPRGPGPLVRLQTGPEGLILTAHQSECTLRYHMCGSFPPDVLTFPARYLVDFEAGKSTLELEAVTFGKGRARWTDGGVEFDTVVPEGVPEPPAEPVHFTQAGPDMLLALAEASQTAARDTARFALSHIQLRGKQGEIVATDGRQMLVQGGFDFPWSNDVLVPAMPVFGCREFQSKEKVALGRTDTHVALQMGPWTLWMATDTKARYPDTDTDSCAAKEVNAYA